MDREMTACPWDSIDRFSSFAEFSRFRAWMTTQIETGQAAEVDVVERYLDISSFSEQWFEHRPSRTVWRLVWPDAPFAGLFEQVASVKPN
jgi:hypothetical protein